MAKIVLSIPLDSKLAAFVICGPPLKDWQNRGERNNDVIAGRICKKWNIEDAWQKAHHDALIARPKHT